MNDNSKNNILLLENIRQTRLKILEYFDAYICHHYQSVDMHWNISLFCLIFSNNKMLFFELSFILYMLQLSGRNGF